MKLTNKITVFVIILMTFMLSSCASSSSASTRKNPVATITMKNGGLIKIELYPDKAPNTVNNFISLANSKFYDGLTFHRIEEGFVVQGGDPEANGSGGPGYTIKGEFSDNGFTKNDLKHTTGVISMARRSQPLDSAGSQFFIMLADQPSLDGKYAAFGKVIEGMDVVNKMVSDFKEGNVTDFSVMKTVTVDTFGAKYSKPEKIKE